MMKGEGGVVSGLINKMQVAAAHVMPAETLANQHSKWRRRAPRNDSTTPSRDPNLPLLGRGPPRRNPAYLGRGSTNETPAGMQFPFRLARTASQSVIAAFSTSA
jgi:hypothetical protein